MPRAGLDQGVVVAAGAALADEVGFTGLTMARLAERVGVRTPSLYKHVMSQDDLNRRIAVLALTEVGDVMGAAIQGRSGRQALGAAAQALRTYALDHPGRYAATISFEPTGPDDPIVVAAAQGLRPLAAVLRSYDIAPDQTTHALRAMRSAFHGFASIQSTGGFRWSADLDESFEWLVDLLDHGLRSLRHRSPPGSAAGD